MSSLVLSVTPTVGTASYATGDLIGAAAMAFPAIGTPYRSGKLVAVDIIDLSGQSAALDVVLFSANPTASTFADNDAVALHSDDFAKVITTVTFAASDYKVLATGKSFGKVILAAPLPFVLSTAVIYAILVSRGSPDYVAATDVTVRLHLEID